MNKYIFDWLSEKLGNQIGAAALMGNLFVESKLQPTYLEKTTKCKLSGQEYTFIFDDATDKEADVLCHDGIGYGLAQWTYWSRKKALWEYSKEQGKSIGNIDIQLGYLWKELQGYKEVIKALKNAVNLREASDIVCLKYEKPAHTEEKYLQNRANYGLEFYEAYSNQSGKEESDLSCNTTKYVEDEVKKMKEGSMTLMEIAWAAALLCVGWAYVFGARGEYCDPSNRRRYAREDHPTIKSKCKNFKGADTAPGGCVGCQWFLGDSTYDKNDPHKGRTRFFDCRGFVYWILKLVYSWVLQGQGATSQWNTESNWSAKGKVADGVPANTLVCLFVRSGNKMEHVGFGYNGETVECSAGVQHFTKMNKKWTDWAVPKCVSENVVVPDKEPESSGTPIITYPTIRQGSKGEVVTQLQTFLAKDGSNLQIDGIFGSGTASAVRAFQRRYGLTVDGIVGPKTWAKLLEVAGNIKTSEPAPKEEVSKTLIIPNLSVEDLKDLTAKYSDAVAVEYEDVRSYIENR